jgi:hypothetical protein
MIEKGRSKKVFLVSWGAVLLLVVLLIVIITTNYNRDSFVGVPLCTLKDNYFYTVENLFETKGYKIAFFLEEKKSEKEIGGVDKFFIISRARLRGQDNKILTLKEIPKKFFVERVMIFPPEQPGERREMRVYILIPISSS